MMDSTCRLSLEEILNRPTGLLVLHGHDDEDPDPAERDGDESEDTEDEEDSNSGGSDDDKPKGKKAEPDAKDKRIAGLEEERDRHYAKRKEAEQKLTDANKKIKALEKDGMSDAEAAAKIKDLEGTNAGLAETNRKLALENAFLKDNTRQWQSPARALQLADLSEVEIDEDGSVHGLQKALDALAKSDPYLLKPSKDDSDEDDSGNDQQQRRQTGRRPAGGTQTQAKKTAQEAALRLKYPGLRR